jgi:hypothetical protein
MDLLKLQTVLQELDKISISASPKASKCAIHRKSFCITSLMGPLKMSDNLHPVISLCYGSIHSRFFTPSLHLLFYPSASDAAAMVAAAL